MNADKLTQMYLDGLVQSLARAGYDADFVVRISSAILEGLGPLTTELKRLNSPNGISFVLPAALEGLSTHQQQALLDLVGQQLQRYTQPLIDLAMQTAAEAIAARVVAEERLRMVGMANSGPKVH